ncbi:hypothetical protein NMG60_11004410 [Bertholletia excelsa]
MATEGCAFSHQDAEPNEDMAELLYPRRRCCFCMPCFGSNRSPATGVHWWQRMRKAENEEKWWARGINALKKLREWSEIIAGPRWKTFIRRFNRDKSSGGGGKNGKFQYDPLSYALNFDDGLGKNGNSDEEYGFRNFSSRYAVVPVPAKSSSIEIGKDTPTFT